MRYHTTTTGHAHIFDNIFGRFPHRFAAGVASQHAGYEEPLLLHYRDILPFADIYQMPFPLINRRFDIALFTPGKC